MSVGRSEKTTCVPSGPATQKDDARPTPTRRRRGLVNRSRGFDLLRWCPRRTGPLCGSGDITAQKDKAIIAPQKAQKVSVFSLFPFFRAFWTPQVDRWRFLFASNGIDG